MQDLVAVHKNTFGRSNDTNCHCHSVRVIGQNCIRKCTTSFHGGVKRNSTITLSTAVSAEHFYSIPKLLRAHQPGDNGRSGAGLARDRGKTASTIHILCQQRRAQQQQCVYVHPARGNHPTGWTANRRFLSRSWHIGEVWLTYPRGISGQGQRACRDGTQNYTRKIYIFCNLVLLF